MAIDGVHSYTEKTASLAAVFHFQNGRQQLMYHQGLSNCIATLVANLPSIRSHHTVMKLIGRHVFSGPRCACPAIAIVCRDAFVLIAKTPPMNFISADIISILALYTRDIYDSYHIQIDI